MRCYFIKKFSIDPPIINRDQMHWHRNKSSSQATLNFKDSDFCKKNPIICQEMMWLCLLKIAEYAATWANFQSQAWKTREFTLKKISYIFWKKYVLKNFLHIRMEPDFTYYPNFLLPEKKLLKFSSLKPGK